MHDTTDSELLDRNPLLLIKIVKLLITSPSKSFCNIIHYRTRSSSYLLYESIIPFKFRFTSNRINTFRYSSSILPYHQILYPRYFSRHTSELLNY